MPTKTTSKTARKPAAHKTTAHKAKPSAAKAKVVKKKAEPEHKPAAKPHVAPATKAHAPHPPVPKAAPKPSPTPRREVESVSLIDGKKPKQKSEDGEVKKKSTVLPPISRIRASMEPPAFVAPPVAKPAEVT